jgi:hypothetical protein
VMSTWCDRGVAAWRLDAAYAVPPAFWRRVLPAVRERHPTCGWSARSSTATTPATSRSPAWTRSPGTSCGRPSGARWRTATCSSWRTPCAGTTP